jgi:uncharacterized membrane protein YkvA (DUF1232 family)
MLRVVRERAKNLKLEALAVAEATRDRRTPKPAKLLAFAVVAYAASPIDLIPDFIPVLGMLDDLILIPLGIGLLLRMIPPDVMADARARVRDRERAPSSYAGALVVVAIWALAIALAWWIFARLRR